MTGSALLDFLITLVVIGGAVAIIFYAIDGISPDARFTKIARVAIGVAAAVIFLLAVKAVLFGGGGMAAISPINLLYFAIAVIVVLLVVYVVRAFLEWVQPPFLAQILYLLAAFALIAFLYAAAALLLGGRAVGLGRFTKAELPPGTSLFFTTTAPAGWVNVSGQVYRKI